MFSKLGFSLCKHGLPCLPASRGRQLLLGATQGKLKGVLPANGHVLPARRVSKTGKQFGLHEWIGSMDSWPGKALVHHEGGYSMKG